MQENNNIALIRNIYAAFERGDIRTIMDHLAPDVEWTLNGPSVIPYAGKKIGPDQVLTFFEALATTQEDHKLTVDEYIAQCDVVVTVGRFAATVKATGKRIDGPVAHIFTIRDGRIARLLDFVDTAQMADAYIR